MVRGLFDNPFQLLLVLVVVVILFGAKRLPDAARGLGRSLRIFKSEIKEMQEDDGRPSRSTGRSGSEALEGQVVDRPAARESTRQAQDRTPTDRKPEV